VLLELTIRNFAVIRDMRIEFGAGMNALTGETGAGKSIVIDALGAVLGARTSAEFVRTGAPGAYVEAVFDLAAMPTSERVLHALASFGVDHDLSEPLVLARDVSAGGRSTARVAGRTLTAGALATLGELLVDIHGQSDHLSLLRPATQLDLLDRFAGTLTQREQVAERVRNWHVLRRRVSDFDNEQRARAQRLDLLRFQADELASAAVQPDEDELLHRERGVLANAEKLALAAAQAQAALSGDNASTDLDVGALDRLRVADHALLEMSAMDPGVEPTLTRLRDALFALEEVAAELRDYAERTELDPARLEEVDERLDLLRRLKRKYGPTLHEVLLHAEQVQRDLAEIESSVDIEHLRAEEAAARDAVGQLAAKLSHSRQTAATDLARGVERAIAELNMGRAAFDVRFETAPDPHGVPTHDGRELVAVDATGVDRITFYLAANAGEELRPLGKVASGGETARLMLALKSILSAADETPILVFDEVDVGVGGRSGQVVGEKLWSLIDAHQVIVITHLPQIAAFADRHLTLDKREADGRTETSARAIDGAERIDELAAMLDGLPPTPESRSNADALLRRVNGWKRSARGE
jgi:DNA repair protein RecN (Recombination protein N)